jgi:hypothetical protein
MPHFRLTCRVRQQAGSYSLILATVRKSWAIASNCRSALAREEAGISATNAAHLPDPQPSPANRLLQFDLGNSPKKHGRSHQTVGARLPAKKPAYPLQMPHICLTSSPLGRAARRRKQPVTPASFRPKADKSLNCYGVGNPRRCASALTLIGLCFSIGLCPSMAIAGSRLSSEGTSRACRFSGSITPQFDDSLQPLPPQTA